MTSFVHPHDILVKVPERAGLYFVRSSLQAGQGRRERARFAEAVDADAVPVAPFSADVFHALADELRRRVWPPVIPPGRFVGFEQRLAGRISTPRNWRIGEGEPGGSRAGKTVSWPSRAT